MNAENDKSEPKVNSKKCIDNGTKSTRKFVLKELFDTSKENPKHNKEPEGNEVKGEGDADGGSGSARVRCRGSNGGSYSGGSSERIG